MIDTRVISVELIESAIDAIESACAMMEAYYTQGGCDQEPRAVVTELQALLSRSTAQPAPATEAVAPENFGLIPLSHGKPIITNAMKAKCIGEFTMRVTEVDEFLLPHLVERTVPWDVCKKIYKAMAVVAMEYKPAPVAQSKRITCPGCNGTGSAFGPEHVCNKCNGTGRAQSQEGEQ